MHTRATAWPAYNQRFGRALVSYFERRMRNPMEAENLAQEVFVRLARRPDQYHGENIEAHVFKIAASVLTDWGRREPPHLRNARKTLSPSAREAALPDDLIEIRTPERVLAGKAERKTIEDALSALTQRTRDIFLLSKLDGLSYPEIAERYGVSVSAAEKHVMKALAHIGRKTAGK